MYINKTSCYVFGDLLYTYNMFEYLCAEFEIEVAEFTKGLFFIN